MFTIPYHSYLSCQYYINGELQLPNSYDPLDEPEMFESGCTLKPDSWYNETGFNENDNQKERIDIEIVISLLTYQEAKECPYTIRRNTWKL